MIAEILGDLYQGDVGKSRYIFRKFSIIHDGALNIFAEKKPGEKFFSEQVIIQSSSFLLGHSKLIYSKFNNINSR